MSQEQIYQSDIVLTSDQEEEDSIHGIFERGKRRITIDWEKKSVSFNEDYYYEYQRQYELQVTKKLVVDLKGTFEGQKQAQQLKCTVLRQVFQGLHELWQEAAVGSFTLRRKKDGFNMCAVVIKDGQNAIATVIDRPLMLFSKV